jgi:hypothetical protein
LFSLLFAVLISSARHPRQAAPCGFGRPQRRYAAKICGQNLYGRGSAFSALSDFNIIELFAEGLEYHPKA